MKTSYFKLQISIKRGGAEEGEHSTGLAFFHAVGVVAGEVGGGVLAGVVEVFYPKCGGLFVDQGGDIYLVVRRADAGRDLRRGARR